MNIYLASTYGNGSFDSSTYNGATSSGTASQPSGSSTSGGSVLANTGFDVVLAISLACAICLAAILVRVMKRPPQSQ